MAWLYQLVHETTGVAHAIFVLSLAAALGLGLGALRIFGVGLGVAGVLFAGLFLGHFHVTIDHQTREFAREFGLILFVYTIGMQVGPGFIASLRRNGLPLNLMAAAIVLCGVGMTLGIYAMFMPKADLPMAVGLFSGASTNTPSLAAAQQALKDLLPAGDLESAKLPGLGYAVAYPFGIVGIILAMLILRVGFRISPARESELLAKAMRDQSEPLSTLNIEIKNPNFEGFALGRIPMLGESGVVVSRILHQGESRVARGNSTVHVGDCLLAVGTAAKLEQFRLMVGDRSPMDLRALPSAITSRRILVTRSEALGKTVPHLNFGQRLGVTVTRIHRADLELSPTRDVRLQFGDMLMVVGEQNAIRQAAEELGDSPRRLDHPQIIPVFVGLALGVVLGSWPISLPGMPAPIKLGLAGGPLLVAIVLSRLGNFGPLVWHLPTSANFILREIGIVLFLASVGLGAGDRFVSTLTHGSGLAWMGYGAAITLVPLLLVGAIARLFFKLNYLSLCGLLAGAMTDPPALAFANSLTGSEGPSVAYATVYPLVMLMRVVAAQAMILFLFK